MPRTRPLLIVLALLLFAAWAAATSLLLFFPDESVPAHANAIVVLSGTKRARLERGLQLMRQGIAPVLVISRGLPRQLPAERLCAAGHEDGFRVFCFKPRPNSTRGEAEAVGRLAASRHWDSILLVTSRYHVTRAKLLFKRCFHGQLDADGVSYSWTTTPVAVIGEWAKLVYALTLARGC